MCGGGWLVRVCACVSLLVLVAGQRPPLRETSYGAVDKRPYKHFLRFGRSRADINDLNKILSGYDNALHSEGSVPIPPFNGPLPYTLVTSGNNGPPYGNMDISLQDLYAAKRAASDKNFLRFGKRYNDRNFLRFGRSGGFEARNLIRPVRSVYEDLENYDQSFNSPDNRKSEKQLKIISHLNEIEQPQGTSSNLDHPYEETNMDVNHSRSKRDVENNFDHAILKRPEPEHSLSKRAIPNLFALLNLPEPSGLTSNDWLGGVDDMAGFKYGDETSKEQATTLKPSEAMQEIQKRTFPHSFLRYGREPTDLNFIRFGKRDSSEENDSEASGNNAEPTVAPGGSLAGGGYNSLMDQIMMARNNKNFLRFGR